MKEVDPAMYFELCGSVKMAIIISWKGVFNIEIKWSQYLLQDFLKNNKQKHNKDKLKVVAIILISRRASESVQLHFYFNALYQGLNIGVTCAM